MRLVSFSLTNFRKFGESDNTIEFSEAASDRALGAFSPKESGEERTERAIGASTTLLIGKNNAGKSTVVKALDKLINDGGQFGANDFNYRYLQKRLDKAKEERDFEPPEMSFCLKVHLNANEQDLIGNIYKFLKLGNLRSGEDVEIKARWVARESEHYKLSLESEIDKPREDGCEFALVDFIALIGETDYTLSFYGADGKPVTNFSLKSLINLEFVDAVDIKSEKCLSKAFNDIVAYRYKNDIDSFSDVDKLIDEMNDRVDATIGEVSREAVNHVLAEEQLGRELEAVLTADITFDKMMNHLLRYEYRDGNDVIPEGQFGLGYTRLVMVIAHIIKHIDKAEEGERNSKINLMILEEPENHMHPQMQEFFISYIAKAVEKIIEKAGKRLNSQLLVTTHSDHIVHSKIQSGNSFDFINSIQERDGLSHAVILRDANVRPDNSDEGSSDGEAAFNFLKRHMRLSDNSIFFVDGIILVEGMTERLLLPLYIYEQKELRNRYIALIEVNGAHAHVYFNLISALGTPCVVLTDLDIKRSKAEKEDANQIHSLDGETTTNASLKTAMGRANIQNLTSLQGEIVLDEKSLIVFTQDACEGSYPSSFEEALILANHDNAFLNFVLRQVRPGFYSKHVGKDPQNRDLNWNREHSMRWQKTLNDKKGEFATTLLFELLKRIETDSCGPSDILSMPSYIESALCQLESMLQEGD